MARNRWLAGLLTARSRPAESGATGPERTLGQRSQNATPPSSRAGRPTAATSAAIEEASSRMSARIRGGLSVIGRPSPRRIGSSLGRELLIDEAYVDAFPLTQVQRHVVEQQAEDDQ